MENPKSPVFTHLSGSVQKKILVIENDSSIADVVKELLDLEGYNYVIYDDAVEIQPLLKEHQPDLILLDYLLDNTNGGELCSQVKKTPETAQIPVIIYSAAPKVLQSLGYYGCDLFISKPFDLDYMATQIRQLLADREALHR